MAEGRQLDINESAKNLKKERAMEFGQANEMDVGMDRFLQRSMSERMYELRHIQHGERPVTGQGNRESINNFFSKRIETRNHAESSGKANIPANVDSVEEHRPEAVVIEIQGVSEQGRVSNVLQSALFRRHLEHIIRGSISTVTRRNTPSPITGARSTSETTLLRSLQNESVRSRSGSISSSRSASGNSVDSNPEVNRNEIQSVSNNGTPIPIVPQIPDPPALNENRTRWSDIQQLHRQDVVEEISELIHQQIVSTTLEGDFRRTLEIHVQNHLSMTGTDGERVQEFIQSIPQSGAYVRNDFSELGLQTHVQGDNWDNVSVASISATAVPYTQTNLHMSRQISSLKSEMEEMKSMLRLSFDLQLDIQRAIRQEVSAALARHTASGEATGTEACPSSNQSRPINDTHCLICLDKFSDSVLYQCGHMCVCYACGRHLMSRNAKCPVCRAPIKDIIRTYRCNQD